MPELGQAEFASDRKRDESQSGFVDEADAAQILEGLEADAGDTKQAQPKWTDEKPRDEERGHVREVQMQQFENAGKDEPREQGNSYP